MRKRAVMLLLAAVMSLALVACGGSGDGADGGSAAGNGGGTKAAQQGNNWDSADEIESILENDYEYKDVETLTNMDDENDKTYRMTRWREDEMVEHFVDLSFDAKTNEITDFGWYYETHSSDIEYWMETIGLVITNPDDQKIIRDTLTGVEVGTYIDEIELSDATMSVGCFGDDDYTTLNVYIDRK